jgi:hypothetical protein
MAMKATPLEQHMLGEATLLYANREFQQAIALLLEAIWLAPGLPHAYHTLGLIYEETGQAKKLSRRSACQGVGRHLWVDDSSSARSKSAIATVITRRVASSCGAPSPCSAQP